MVDAPSEELERLPSVRLGLRRLVAIEVDLGERGADVAGVDREVELDEHAEGHFEERDGFVRVAQEMAEPGEVVEEAGHGGFVSQPIEQRP